MLRIQQKLVAPRDKSAGRYKYRNVEDLYERIKPLLDAPLSVTTDAIELGGQILIKATARYKESESVAFCAVENTPKNMSIGQAYGAATSYATKYAFCMLFCVDNGEDLDGLKKEEKEEKTPKQILYEKMDSACMDKEEMKAFYDAYCTNEHMLGRVVIHFDRFLKEWQTRDQLQ